MSTGTVRYQKTRGTWGGESPDCQKKKSWGKKMQRFRMGVGRRPSGRFLKRGTKRGKLQQIRAGDPVKKTGNLARSHRYRSKGEKTSPRTLIPKTLPKRPLGFLTKLRKQKTSTGLLK